MPSLYHLLSGFATLTVALATPLNPRQSYPNPEPCTGACSGVHDPSILKDSGGTWWRFSTENNIQIASAPAITGPWTYLGLMLPSGSSIHVASNQGLWAPDVSYLDGQYVAYYAVSTPGSQNSGIGVATAPNPHPGSWTDHGSIGIPQNSAYNLIDPNFFRHGPGETPYLTFGSFWGGIFQTQLNAGFLTYNGAVAPTNKVHSPSSDATEGSFQFWWNVGGVDYYYLFWSAGICCNTPPNLPAAGQEYHVLVCRATGPTGPFVDRNGNACSNGGGTVVLASHGSVYAPGGQGVYADSSLAKPVLYYHYVNPAVGYEFADFQFGFNYLDFSSGWPVVTTA